MSRTDEQPARTRGATESDGAAVIVAAKAACNTLSAILTRVGMTVGAPDAHAAHKAAARELALHVAALMSPAEPITLTPDEPAAEAAQQSEAVPEGVVIPTVPKAPRKRA
jgi:hypothetical protein